MSPAPTRTRSKRGPPVPTETELKLAIAPGVAAAIRRHPVVVACKRGRIRRARLVSVYFDTADDWLARQGIALRLRQNGRRWVQTLKGSGRVGASGGMSTRVEFEWPVPGPALDPLRFVTTPYRRQLARAQRHGLHPRFTTDFTRTSIPLAFADSTMATLCIDEGEIRSEEMQPPRHTALHEIEIELEAGNPLRIFEFAYALAANIALLPESRSKAQRGLALRHPPTAKPVHAKDVDLAADASGTEAMQAIMRSCLAQIEGNAPGVVADDDPEWVHQMRIGVRRLRALLSLARKTLPAVRVEPLRTELRWLAQALGSVRDFDVFATQTLPEVRAGTTISGNPRTLSAALRSLEDATEQKRRAARSTLRAAVASPRYVRLVLSAAALVAMPAAGANVPAKLARPARELARPMLKRRQRKLRELGEHIAQASPEARHAARLAAKKLRYATEFFSPLFPRKGTSTYRKALTVLQEQLGAWNDVTVAARLAGELAGIGSAAAAAFAGWEAASAQARNATLAKAWSAYRKTRPFWSQS